MSSDSRSSQPGFQARSPLGEVLQHWGLVFCFLGNPHATTVKPKRLVKEIGTELTNKTRAQNQQKEVHGPKATLTSLPVLSPRVAASSTCELPRWPSRPPCPQAPRGQWGAQSPPEGMEAGRTNPLDVFGVPAGWQGAQTLTTVK